MKVYILIYNPPYDGICIEQVFLHRKDAYSAMDKMRPKRHYDVLEEDVECGIGMTCPLCDKEGRENEKDQSQSDSR